MEEARWNELMSVARAASRAETRAAQLAAQRDQLIVELYQAGYTQQTIANLALMSRQRVGQIIARYKKRLRKAPGSDQD